MRTLNEETLRRMEEYIRERQRKDGVSPSYRRIMHALGMSSLNLVQRYVLALENQGRIRRTRLGSIALPKRLDAGKNKITPLVGDIACGQPSFAEENIEASYALPEAIFGKGELFMLHTHGDSMIDANIYPGDFVFFSKGMIKGEGIYVIAFAGDIMVKRLSFDGPRNKLTIISENKNYPVRTVDADTDGVRILGKVIGWIHNEMF